MVLVFQLLPSRQLFLESLQRNDFFIDVLEIYYFLIFLLTNKISYMCINTTTFFLNNEGFYFYFLILGPHQVIQAYYWICAQLTPVGLGTIWGSVR